MAQAKAVKADSAVKVEVPISKAALKAQLRYHTLEARKKAILAEMADNRAVMDAQLDAEHADVLTYKGVAVVERVQTTGAQVVDIASILKYFPAAAKYVTRKAAGTRFDAKKRAY